ncbi:hypothetical protein BABINDRAFT_14962 [Babjeviella inositovora NRRL Y-12698]|uniref:Uncharacterized protein n=1 Tax=Babjeviella inositovora NRRL Y-12698 TaxID=984486 RepID=A0A1E3QJW5_9ASCO|nr:uncharacterized protein BABINDRAFT_14962 [Babjeviella inositovora NRRL Y-12698]ODQ77981.1 hypothetical protein BABINDRAFT_14962 [Babjeviella inositovora NRRL Y-12698]
MSSPFKIALQEQDANIRQLNIKSPFSRSGSVSPTKFTPSKSSPIKRAPLKAFQIFQDDTYYRTTITPKGAVDRVDNKENVLQPTKTTASPIRKAGKRVPLSVLDIKQFPCFISLASGGRLGAVLSLTNTNFSNVEQLPAFVTPPRDRARQFVFKTTQDAPLVTFKKAKRTLSFSESKEDREKIQQAGFRIFNDATVVV